jgi:hypothetical protein
VRANDASTNTRNRDVEAPAALLLSDFRDFPSQKRRIAAAI